MSDHIPDPTKMSNHLGDTNKMVSDTPRMDASAYDDGAIWEAGCDIERELNAANERIRRLNEAGDRMEKLLPEGSICDKAVNLWNQAKEDKL